MAVVAPGCVVTPCDDLEGQRVSEEYLLGRGFELTEKVDSDAIFRNPDTGERICMDSRTCEVLSHIVV